MDARELRAIRRVKVLGCGSAYYVGQMGASLVEELARIPADAEAASEFRYRNPIIEPDTLYVAVSQSGETIDTLLAVQEIRRKGGRVIGLVNVVGSAIARECDGGIYLHAGPEVAVASTKALTNMYVAFALLALQLGRVRDLSIADGRRLVGGLQRLPGQIAEVLDQEPAIAAIAERLAEAESLFFIGRVRGYPVAREGAQKFKEISYRHAEAYQTSELKHGPLALIDERVPTVAVVPDDELTDRNVGALHEVAAREGPARRRHPRGGRPRRGAGGEPDRRTPQRARAGPDPDDRGAAAAGLPRRAAPRSRHRQATQPGEVRHGRVSGRYVAAHGRAASWLRDHRQGAAARAEPVLEVDHPARAALGGSKPTPSSCTVNHTRPSASPSESRTRSARECLAAFWSASTQQK